MGETVLERWGRLAPGLLITSATGALLVTAGAAFVDPALARPGHPHYLGSGAVMTVVDLLLALGLAGLAATPAARDGWPKTAATILMVVGSFGMVPAEVLLRVDFALGNGVFGVVGPLQAAGLIVFGIVVIRTGRWISWRRFAPLGFGLYIPLVMLPTLIATRGDSLVALAGYHTCVLLLGVAALLESRRQALPAARAAA